MLETHARFSVLRVEQSRYPLTTSPRTKVQDTKTFLWALSNLIVGEKARISAAGGFVDFGRVNGNLALSRAIGDFEFKKSADLSPEQQIVTAFPDVISHEISTDDEFLVIACDGRASFLQSRWLSLTMNRYLGLSVFPSRDRIRAKRDRCQTRTVPDL